MSYSELAQRSGYSAGASKVVGYAINKNPYMLVVGDHRVVKASGEIWCENESQRNKLRRLLVYHEIGFTKESLEEALLRVKGRNESTKGTRKRNTVKSTGSKSQVKKELGAKAPGGIKKKTAVKKKSASKKSRRKPQDESDDSEIEDDDDDDSDYE